MGAFSDQELVDRLLELVPKRHKKKKKDREIFCQFNFCIYVFNINLLGKMSTVSEPPPPPL